MLHKARIRQCQPQPGCAEVHPRVCPDSKEELSFLSFIPYPSHWLLATEKEMVGNVSYASDSACAVKADPRTLCIGHQRELQVWATRRKEHTQDR